MNNQRGITINTDSLKASLWLAMRAVLVALALMAVQPVWASDPIPGIDIIINKEPVDSSIASGRTDERGVFSVQGIESGNYSIRLHSTRIRRGAKGYALVTINSPRQRKISRKISKSQLMAGAQIKVRLAGPTVSIVIHSEGVN